MGISERREREKQRRRAEILDTSRALFFEKGFRDTTIDDIARSAELARGTIYLYFENKEEIYATIMEEGVDILDKLIQEASNPEADPMTNILAGHDAFLRFHDEYPQYYNVLMLDRMQISDLLPQPLRERIDQKTSGMAHCIAHELERGIREGYFRPMPVHEVAYLQMGMAMGFAQMLDKCGKNSGVFESREQSRQLMHDMIAMGIMLRQNREL